MRKVYRSCCRCFAGTVGPRRHPERLKAVASTDPKQLPAVSFLKAPGFQDGHAGYSNPFDEQRFITSQINALEHTPDWSSTAVIVAYDNSDGFYDHVYSGIHYTSNTAAWPTLTPSCSSIP